MAFYDSSFNLQLSNRNPLLSNTTHHYETTFPLFIYQISFVRHPGVRAHAKKCVSQKGGLNILRLNSEIACMKYPGRH